MIDQLTSLGLSQEESKIYLATLELGGSYASNIARKAGINRASCYHTLNNLVQKGLVSSYTKGKVLWFNAEAPEKFIKIQEGKLEQAKNLLPQLLSISSSFAFKPKIKFFEGSESIKSIFEDILTTKEKEILGYTNIKSIANIFPGYFKNFCERKLKKKIKTRYLSPSTGLGTDVIEEFYPPNYDRNLIEILLVDNKEFHFENDISIYENKVAIISLNPKEPIAVLIESETFAKSMKSIFDLAWLGATAFIAR